MGPKSRYFGNFDFNQNLTSIKIFFEIFGKIMTKFEIFRWNVGPKSRCFEYNWDFSKILETFKIDFDHRNVSNEIEIFRRFWLNLKYSQILTKIAIFLKIWPNRDLQRFWPKSQFFEIFHKIRILTSIEIFGKCDHNRDFSNILNKMGIFRKFCPKSTIILIKSRYFENLQQNRDFQRFCPKSLFF